MNAATGHLQFLVKPQFYLDSVALMRMSKTLTENEGVLDAAMMMATPANLDIMANAGLLPGTDVVYGADQLAGAGDLIITVRASSEALAADAMAQSQQLLDQPLATGQGDEWRPRSIRSAASANPDSTLALISVPGDFAASEARKAIRRGLHAMIFSDNVSLEEEIELKQEAEQLGRLVMGPDCGTAIINGVPLAFANVLARGAIGIVGASGTGIQEVSCLLGNAGYGLSHAIGVGGRDLNSQVGGISTLMALSMLENDASTNHIVLISKPPGADVAEKILQRVALSSKTCTVCFIGGEKPALPSNASWANTLEAAALDAMKHASGGKGVIADVDAGNTKSDSISEESAGKYVRGLFCGGTLCAEAQVLMLEAGLQVGSNAAIPGTEKLPVSDEPSGMHVVLDLGADEYTQGKPHPMIEPQIRDDVLALALTDTDVAVVLVDCVIGYGAHENPAGQLAHCVQLARQDKHAKNVAVIASVTGTDADPQSRQKQIAILRAADIQVAASNAQAVQAALRVINKK